MTRWQDKIPDIQVLKRSGLTHLGTMIMQKPLRRLGHVKRMDDSGIPKTVFSVKLVMAPGNKDARCWEIMIIAKVTLNHLI